MNARSATPARAAEYGAARRRKPLGRLLVSDYVGQTAAVAAQAIRRAGLRPGLERSLGCEPELVGQVVAQDPPSGSELARNAMLTLYVAAPGPASADEGASEPPAPPFEPMPSAEAEQAFTVENRAQRAKPRSRRRRKPRPTETRPRVFDTSPTTVQLDTDLALVVPTMFTDSDPTEELRSHGEIPSRAMRDGVLDDEAAEERSDDAFVVDVDDVFAGRAGVSWRRAYPSRRRLTSSRHQHQERWSR
jgi:hypothetical protein